jgi:hypothetical protein
LSERFSTNREAHPHRSLVLLIWLYFWLLIWEGSLRKWIFPSLSAPLLVVRDQGFPRANAEVFRRGTLGFASLAMGESAEASPARISHVPVRSAHGAPTSVGLSADPAQA